MEKHLDISQDVRNLISKKNYPCIAAVQALHRNEILVGAFSDFGSGNSSSKLLEGLVSFKQQAQKTPGSYLTYVAAYPECISPSESVFEVGLWQELSALCAEPQAGPWDEKFSANPQDKNFCISIEGAAFFVVGAHAHSSRLSRRLPYNALIFNLYDQFSYLMQKGTYEAMVRLNRVRDMKFQGSVNPMVELYNEQWEAIQFSGQSNDSNWRCPFSSKAKS